MKKLCKKVIPLLLAVIILLSAFPVMNVFAAKEMFKRIDAVSINEVSSPAAYTEPLYHANVETTGCKINNVTEGSWKNGVTWYEKETQNAAGRAMAIGEKFKPGYYYMIRIGITTSSTAYYFNTKSNGTTVDITATVNGKTATAFGTKNSAAFIDYTYPMCIGTINKLDLAVETPVAGAKPSYAQIKGEGYESNNSRNNASTYKNGIIWYDEAAKEYINPESNTTFKAGQKYTVRFMLSTTTGYKYATKVNANLNGKAATVSRTDNEFVSVSYTFTIPEKLHTHTDSAWKTDANYHWKICTDKECGSLTVASEEHKDANKDNKCDVCAYKLPVATTSSSVSKPTSSDKDTTDKNTDSKKPDSSSNKDTTTSTETETENETETSEPTEEDETANEETVTTGKDGGISPVIWIIIAAAVIIAAIIVFIVIKKSKNK